MIKKLVVSTIDDKEVINLAGGTVVVDWSHLYPASSLNYLADWMASIAFE